MSDSWYRVVDSQAPLTQGDLILSCPISSWNENKRPEWANADSLTACQEIFKIDVIIMTQACDLEENKLRNVILCPAEPVSSFKMEWTRTLEQNNQNPTPKAWRKFLEEVSRERHRNLAILDYFECEEIGTELRIVAFHEIYTLPKTFLQDFVESSGRKRLQLQTPYREHLSQAFARFFMRVGLPRPVNIPD